MRRIAAVGMTVGLVAALSAAPASATVHEIVASFCSNNNVGAAPGHPTGDQHDPPGLTVHEHNLARPLLASGVFETFEVHFEESVTTRLGVEVDGLDPEVPTIYFVEGERINEPPNKFPWVDDATYVELHVDLFLDGEVDQQWIFPKLDIDGDSPAFERCPNFERGPWYLLTDPDADDRIVFRAEHS